MESSAAVVVSVEEESGDSDVDSSLVVEFGIVVGASSEVSSDVESTGVVDGSGELSSVGVGPTNPTGVVGSPHS